MASRHSTSTAVAVPAPHGHHVLATVTGGLAATFPRVPLFIRGTAEVARLTEMAADDAATRTSGRPALVGALLAIATGIAFPAAAPTAREAGHALRLAGQALVPGAALPAAAHAVSDRVERLLRPAGPGRSTAFTAALALVLALLARPRPH